MIYRAGETITFVAYYTASGVAATGLTVSASVYKIGTAGAVATPTVSEQGGGLYYCTYTPSEDGVYVCVFSTADSSVDQQDIAGIAFRGVAGVNNLDTEISSRLASADYTEPPTPAEIDAQLTASHGEGSWQRATIEPIIVQLSSDELEAVLDGQSRKPIEIYKGDSATIEVRVLDADNNPVDLTDASATFTARVRENSDSYVLQKALTITDAANGIMELDITAAETEDLTPMDYPADIELTLSDGTVKTIWKSTLKIKWDVTR